MLDRLLTTCSTIVIATTLMACSDDGPITPTEGAVAPLSFTLTLDHSNEFGGVEFPGELRGQLHLEIDAAGAVSGVLSAHWQPTGRTYTLAGTLASISGQVNGTSIELNAGQASVWPEGQIDWDSMSLSLQDADGDGAADMATGATAGRWTMVTGDVVNSSDITGSLVAELDTQTAEIRLNSPERGNEFLPIDRIRVAFSEPLTESEAASGVEVLADGMPVSGRVVGIPNSGLLSYLWFEADEFLPFASDISVQAVDLTDPSGNLGSAVPDPISTVADPGPASPVPEFETDLTGWIQLGTVELVGEYAGIAPLEGAMQLRINENSQVLGYIDVPNPVSPFDLSLTLFTEFGEIFEDFSAAIRVHASPQDSELLFDAFGHSEQNAECMNCDDFRFQLGPVSTNIDLSAYSGQRVFLQIEVESLPFIGVERHALVLDNVPLP